MRQGWPSFRRATQAPPKEKARVERVSPGGSESGAARSGYALNAWEVVPGTCPNEAVVGAGALVAGVERASEGWLLPAPTSESSSVSRGSSSAASREWA